MTPRDYMEAARVPRSLVPQEFGLWTIERLTCADGVVDGRLVLLSEKTVGFPDYTMLSRWTEQTLHLVRGEVVMEDSARELRKHLPIWLAARGRVLVTGLGLGCVVRGLLANRDVEMIDVVEIDNDILRVVGAEFAGKRRVRLIQGDALRLEWSPDSRWEAAWHDLWVEGPNLQMLHAELFFRFHHRARLQGAWAFPREYAKLYARRWGINLLGAPRHV
jgi:hypothetical protein